MKLSSSVDPLVLEAVDPGNERRERDCPPLALIALTWLLFLALTTTASAQPANDACANATAVSATPYTDTEVTLAATTEPQDPAPPDPSCVSGPCGDPDGTCRGKSVWYVFTAPTSGTITADTEPSCLSGAGPPCTDYDTILAAYTGSCGSFQLVLPEGCLGGANAGQACSTDANCPDSTCNIGCNDDDPLDETSSKLSFQAEAGTTYYFMISAFNDDGGNLVFHLNFSGTSTTATPTATSTDTATTGPTDTPTNTPTVIPSATSTPTSSATPTQSRTSTPTQTATLIPTATPSATPSQTPTAVPSDTPTVTGTTPATSTPGNSPTPTSTATHAVSGHVRYDTSGLAVEAVDVHLDGATSQVASTDAGGAFAFTGLSEGNWTLEPQKQGGVGTAISTLDAVYVLQGVVGLRQLSAAQQLACDTSGDGGITTLDAVFILQYVVGLIPTFPVALNCGSDWVFVPVPTPVANQHLIQPHVSAGNCQRGAIALEPLVSDANDQDFSALVFGDCTLDWRPSMAATAAASMMGSSSAASVRLRPVRGGRARRVRFGVSVQSSEPFHALDSQLNYDATSLRLIGVRTLNGARNALVQYNANIPGTVVLALANASPITSGRESILVLDFERRKSGRLRPPQVRTAAVDGRPAAVLAGE